MNPSQKKLMEGLPGAELILAGLRELHENRLTVPDLEKQVLNLIQ